jgi:hypothetical protein
VLRISDFGIESFVKHLLIVVAALALCSSAFANLGDSEGKVNASYGKLVERHLRDKTGQDITTMEEGATVSDLYENGDLLILVIFAKGVSVFEMYAHQNGSVLSPEVITKFLDLNSEGWKWSVDKENDHRFERSDHRAEATNVELGARPSLTVRALPAK